MFRDILFLIILISVASCSTGKRVASETLAENTTAINHAGGNSGLAHMLKIHADVSGIKTKLIFDTGIGVNLISKPLCKKLNCKISGSVTGKRTTGQSVTIPTAKIKSLRVANRSLNNVTVGVLDLKSFLPNKPEFEGVEGYLSLTFFGKQAFTIDYPNHILILETPESLKNRIKNGNSVSLTKKFEDGALTIQIPVRIPTNKVLKMQLDLGTNIISINNKYADLLKPLFNKETLKSDSLVDETNFKRKRFFVKIKGDIKPASDNIASQKNPIVMFQKMIYDGMIGNDFFKDRVTTYDLQNSILIVGEQ